MYAHVPLHSGLSISTSHPPAFFSMNHYSGDQLSHWDDLETLTYLLVYLTCGSLPWIDANLILNGDLLQCKKEGCGCQTVQWVTCHICCFPLLHMQSLIYTKAQLHLSSFPLLLHSNWCWHVFTYSFQYQYLWAVILDERYVAGTCISAGNVPKMSLWPICSTHCNQKVAILPHWDVTYKNFFLVDMFLNSRTLQAASTTAAFEAQGINQFVTVDCGLAGGCMLYFIFVCYMNL